MSSDQHKQFNHSTTGSYGQECIAQIFSSDLEDDPCMIVGNGSIDVDESQLRSQEIILFFAELYGQRQDLFGIERNQEIYDLAFSEGGQRIEQEEENPSISQRYEEKVQDNEKNFDKQKDEGIEDEQISSNKKIQASEKEKVVQKKGPKTKNIKKRIKQQMSSLGENPFESMKKNSNVTNAIIRYLIAFHKQFKDTLFSDYPEEFNKLSMKMKELSELKKRSTTKNPFTLTHYEQLFSVREWHTYSQLNRLLMRKILQKYKVEKIMKNNQVKDKLEYLVTAKVFSMRCTNSFLASRMQMR